MVAETGNMGIYSNMKVQHMLSTRGVTLQLGGQSSGLVFPSNPGALSKGAWFCSSWIIQFVCKWSDTGVAASSIYFTPRHSRQIWLSVLLRYNASRSDVKRLQEGCNRKPSTNIKTEAPFRPYPCGKEVRKGGIPTSKVEGTDSVCRASGSCWVCLMDHLGWYCVLSIGSGSPWT